MRSFLFNVNRCTIRAYYYTNYHVLQSQNRTIPSRLSQHQQAGRVGYMFASQAGRYVYKVLLIKWKFFGGDPLWFELRVIVSVDVEALKARLRESESTYSSEFF